MKRALIVDDDPDYPVFLGRYLINEGFDVVVERSAEEAVRVVQENGPFDLVVSDWMMPGVNGCELTRRVSALENPPKVVVLSAYRGERQNKGERPKECSDCKHAWIEKPTSGPELQALVESLVVTQP